MEKKKAMLDQIEMKLDAGLDRSIETIVGWVKVILQTEHSKKEFFKSECFDTFNENENLNAVSPVSYTYIIYV